MKNKITILLALVLMFVATPIQTVSANEVGDKISGTLSQSWANKGAGVANIKLTVDGVPTGGLNAERLLIGSPMSEVNSVSHNYSFTATKSGTYVITLEFDQMASEATDGKLWNTLPANVSKTHVVKDKQAVITTETKVVDTIIRKFTTSQVKDSNMLEGETKVLQVGVDGLIEKTEIITYSNGVEISRKAGPDRIKKEMKPEVISIGTKAKEQVKPKPDNKPIVKDPEPQPEVNKPIIKNSDKKDPIKKDPIDDVVEKDIDFTKIVDTVIFTAEELGLELTPKFDSQTNKYNVEIPFGTKEVSMRVSHKDYSKYGVIVDYAKNITLGDSNKAVIQITQQGKFQHSYEFTFIEEGTVIREYSGKVDLYLTKDLDLNDLEIIELKYLDLEQNELGYYKLDSGYLALLKRDLSEFSTLPAEWWIIVDDKPFIQVQPAVIGGELYLFSIRSITHERLDKELGLHQDLSVKFYEYFLSVRDVETLPLYGYTKERGVYVASILDSNNEEVFAEVNTDMDTVEVIEVKDVESPNDKASTIVIIIIVLIVLLSGGLGIIRYIEVKNNKERNIRELFRENQIKRGK